MDLDRIARREIRRRIDQEVALRMAHRHPQMLGINHLCGFGAGDSELSTDPYWASVVLAMHFDGTNGSTTFTDIKGHTVSSAGSPVISTARSKFGGASGLFSGSPDALSLAESAFLFSGAATFDCWVYPTNANCEIASYVTNDSTKYWELYIPNSTSLDFRINGTVNTAQWTGADLTNDWHYVEWSRDASNVCRVFVDGVLGANSSTDSMNFSGIHASLHLMKYFGGGYHVNGNMDDARFTIGVARHTSGYSVPSAAFPETA